MIDESVPEIGRGELMEILHRSEVQKQLQERCLAIGLCIFCGTDMTKYGSFWACPKCKRTYNR